jgi:DNA invertase Pin-like site-specific DNA recombinase
VLEAFVGECPPGHECRHLNGNKTDNRVENLAWGTSAENARDRVRHGTTTKAGAKLKPDDVSKIRAMLSDGIPQARIAKLFCIGQMTVSDINRNKTWRDAQ